MDHNFTVRNWQAFLQEQGLALYRWCGPGAAVAAEPASVQTPVAPASEEAVIPLTAPSPETLSDIVAELGDCRRCGLAEGRRRIVFGEGNPQARLMFVGEGPGFDEDRTGRPFVGRAGRLLDRMIVAMGLQREDVYIANIVKCRPPNNRDPQPEEVATCLPFLQRQIKAIAPEVVITLGRPAVQALLQTSERISRLRGAWQQVDGVAVMPTYHPAYLLRNPAAKGDAWSDLQAVMQRLGLAHPA